MLLRNGLMLEDITFGGSGMEKVVFDFIESNIPHGSVIVELGSGDVSTRFLSQKYSLYSVEQDERWLNKYNSNYFYAPIRNGWYSPEPLSSLPKKFDLLIIDGPAGQGNRNGILSNLHLIDNHAKILIHDTNRKDEKDLAINLASVLNKGVSFFTHGDFWAFIQ
jgi:hypothetical protein